MKQAIEDKVKQILLDGLKKQGLSWFKTWGIGTESMPMNHLSKKIYRGFNVFILNAEMNDNGYIHNEWITFKQCSQQNGKVKKGSKSTEIFYWHIGVYCPIKKKSFLNWNDAKKNGASDDAYDFYKLRTFRVFNIGQCEGILPVRELKAKDVVEPIESAEIVIQGFTDKPQIQEVEQSKAYYSPVKDLVVIPKKTQFDKVDNFYKTLFHELIHSTGHSDRLNRKGVSTLTGKTDNMYAFEELIAESGAMMLSSFVGLDTCNKNSQAYVNGWIKAVDQSPSKAIVSALTASTKATSYILSNK